MNAQERLNEVRTRISVLANQNDLDEDEVKELDGLNKEAVKLSAKIEGQKQAEALKAAEELRVKNERDEAVAAAKKELQEQLDAANRRPPFGEAPYQAKYSDTWKYDGMTAADNSILIEVMRASGKQVNPAAYKALLL